MSLVFPGSPGASSGIVEDRDYMIGCLQYEYGSVEEFSDKIKVLFDIEADPSLDLYVVDIGTLQGRYVRVKPSNLWKGDGLLGLEFGAGMFDSRTLRDFLEKAAKTANLSVIPMNSHGDHQAMAIQNHDKHSNSANDTSLSLQMNSSSHTGENTIQEGNNGGQHAQLYMPECCYFERKDAKENTYRIKASSLLPALQFPLRQFVYKA